MHPLLAARSTFSIGESILTVERLVEKAKAVGARSIALTDTMSVTALIDFTTRCKGADIKPIIGCRLRLVDDVSLRTEKGKKFVQQETFLTWYVLSEKGLQALFRLLTQANTETNFYFTAKLSWDNLFDALATLTADDVAIATSDVYSVFHHRDASALLDKIAALLSERSVFLTLTPIDSPLFDTLNQKAIEYGGSDSQQFLVSYPTTYAEGEADQAEIMGSIIGRAKITELWHKTPIHRDAHPKRGLEMVAQCQGAIGRLVRRGFPEKSILSAFLTGLRNQDVLVDRVTYEWSKMAPCLPKMAANEFGEVCKLCFDGWRTRFTKDVFGHRPTPADLDTIYKPRLQYELEVLRKLNFSAYFLLVHDIVSFAKKSGIAVGPGRGSVGGSLVAYLIGITECDPIRFGLLFERFINPDRIDLPDADLDFEAARRHEIIAYLIDKYGEKRVAGVSNFGTLGAASAIRDVSRVFELAEEESRCSTLAPLEHGMRVELERAAKLVGEIDQFRLKHPIVWKTCLALEGALRVLGQHAAGIVVGGCDLVERAVIERRSEKARVVCWDKRIVEDQGLIKVDILGLSTLDILSAAVGFIKARHKIDVDLMSIPLDDKAVLDKFAVADTTAIFQFDGGGMRRLLRELGKDGTLTYEDITAATALYRPGPMDSGMMDSYWKRKQGREFVDVDHPAMKDIVEPTYGVLVYQEQVMATAVHVAGYTLPEADKLRKIMGKKLPEEMKKQKDKFVDGAVAHVKMDRFKAEELFEKIAKFAAYGFNKSHSIEYSLISYQAMWLKTNYPVEFFAAALSILDESKLPAIVNNAEKNGIKVILPDINLSTDRFVILSDTELVIPFDRVKGLSGETAREIVRARGSVPFVDKEDLVTRVTRRIVNIGKIDKLERIGALVSLDPASPPATDPTRIRDQVELIPGLITAHVPIHRVMNTDKHHKKTVLELWMKFQRDNCMKNFVMPQFGKHAKFMVITDFPNKGELESCKATVSKGFGAIDEALDEAGLSKADGFFSTLLKAEKRSSRILPDEINTYWPLIKQEIEILKPPVIVMCGSTTVRQFLPDFKGQASAEAGKVHYLKDIDTNVVVGFSPGEIFHAPDKQGLMNQVFEAVASLI